jgi:hypothetical protein
MEFGNPLIGPALSSSNVNHEFPSRCNQIYRVGRHAQHREGALAVFLAAFAAPVVLTLMGCTEQVIARDRHYDADYRYDSNDDPAPGDRAHYCALAAVEVPKLLVRVTLTEATSAEFPETVNGMVSRNSVP